jgi:hypothetical protein
VLTVEQLSKPAVLDSDSDDEPPKDPTDPKEMEALSRRMEAQKLEADRTAASDRSDAQAGCWWLCGGSAGPRFRRCHRQQQLETSTAHESGFRSGLVRSRVSGYLYTTSSCDPGAT